MRITNPQHEFDDRLNNMTWDEVVDLLELKRECLDNAHMAKRTYWPQYDDALTEFEDSLQWCPECGDHFDEEEDMRETDKENVLENLKVCVDCYEDIVRKRRQAEHPYTVDDKIDEIRGR